MMEVHTEMPWTCVFSVTQIIPQYLDQIQQAQSFWIIAWVQASQSIIIHVQPEHDKSTLRNFTQWPTIPATSKHDATHHCLFRLEKGTFHNTSCDLGHIWIVYTSTNCTQAKLYKNTSFSSLFQLLFKYPFKVFFFGVWVYSCHSLPPGTVFLPKSLKAARNITFPNREKSTFQGMSCGVCNIFFGRRLKHIIGYIFVLGVLMQFLVVNESGCRF